MLVETKRDGEYANDVRGECSLFITVEVARLETTTENVEKFLFLSIDDQRSVTWNRIFRNDRIKTTEWVFFWHISFHIFHLWTFYNRRRLIPISGTEIRWKKKFIFGKQVSFRVNEIVSKLDYKWMMNSIFRFERSDTFYSAHAARSIIREISRWTVQFRNTVKIENVSSLELLFLRVFVVVLFLRIVFLLENEFLDVLLQIVDEREFRLDEEDEESEYQESISVFCIYDLLIKLNRFTCLTVLRYYSTNVVNYKKL